MLFLKTSLFKLVSLALGASPPVAEPVPTANQLISRLLTSAPLNASENKSNALLVTTLCVCTISLTLPCKSTAITFMLGTINKLILYYTLPTNSPQRFAGKENPNIGQLCAVCVV